MVGRYRQAVDAGNQRLTFAQVRTAQTRGLEYVAELLMLIMAAFCDGDNPDHTDARAKFLDAFLAHQDQARAARKARLVTDEDGAGDDAGLDGDGLDGDGDGGDVGPNGGLIGGSAGEDDSDEDVSPHFPATQYSAPQLSDHSREPHRGEAEA